MKWLLRGMRRRGCCFWIAAGSLKPDRRKDSSLIRIPSARDNFFSATPVTSPATADADSNGRTSMMHPIFHLLPDAPKPVAPYSHAVEAGGFVFVTGQLATDPVDDSLPIPPGIEAQTRKVMDNLTRVLKGCGLTLADVVCVRIFLTDFNRDYARMNEIFSTYFADDRRPARTTVGVTALARGGIVEIDMIAIRP